MQTTHTPYLVRVLLALACLKCLEPVCVRHRPVVQQCMGEGLIGVNFLHEEHIQKIERIAATHMQTYRALKGHLFPMK